MSCRLRRMARITLVTRNFPPMTGGMERLVHELYRSLARNHEVSLLGPAGSEEYVEPTANVRSTAVSPTGVFLLLTLFKGLLQCRSNNRPDIVIGGSGLVGQVVVFLAKFTGAKTILLVHGLDIIADSRLYQWLFVPFLKRVDLVICNSKNTARLAIASGVDEQDIAIVNPGVDTRNLPISHQEAKRSLALDSKTMLLSVGRLIPRKGLAEFIAESFANLADPNLVFFIAGTEPSGALNKSGTSVLADIENAISAHGLAGQVQLLGHVSDDEISTLYAAADVFVFPLVETPWDVEGFGMVAIEAASHGTPTVAFDCGGVGDAIIDGKNGILINPGNYTKFSEAILHLLQEGSRDSARDFASHFSWGNYGTQIQSCIEKVLI
jgi:phosphatidylinositol alpha-1,6-mannosyltransferase